MSDPRALPGALPAGDRVQDCHQLHLDPHPAVVSVARRFVVDHTDTDTDTSDVLSLLTSELVTNAVLHARTALDVGVTTSDRSFLVTVEDEGPEGPSRSTGERDGGRGLQLVDALAEDWAIVHHDDPEGKTAWFRLPRPQ